MAVLDRPMAALARKLIKAFGPAAVLRVVTRVYDEDTNLDSVSNVDHAVQISPPSPANTYVWSGVEILASDLQFVVANVDNAGVTIEPLPDWLLIFKSSTYRVISVKSLHSGSAVAAYRLLVRK